MLSPLTRLLKTPDCRRILTAPQLAFLSSTAKLRTCCSGRRSGKSFAATIWLIEEWERRPGESSAYIALSQEHSVKIAWDNVRLLNDKFGWGAVYNGTESTWTWPNGFVLYHLGCKDRRSANQIRGVPKAHRFVIDEAGQIPDALLEYLVVDVIEPTLADTDGSVCITGTPADTGVGFFEDSMVTCEATNAHYCWTAAENPHLAIPGDRFIAEALAKRFGGNAQNATYRREYLGHRVQEEGVLVYRTPPLDEFYEPTPTDRNYTTLGIDLGWNDGAGFVVLRSRDPEPGVHVVEAYREVELQVPRIAAIAERMRSEHGVSEIFVDAAGGGGRTICETLAGSYGLPCTPADKRARRMRIEQVRGALDGRTLRGTDGRSQQLLEEWRGLPWNLEKNDHREGYVDECTDALQYAMQGSGFTFTTSWAVEPTAEEVYRRRVEERQRAARSRARAGRR